MTSISPANLVGQTYAARLLQRSILRDRVAHAYLFRGPCGTGKRTAARSLARALLCSQEALGCGKCPSCRSADAGSHPDINIIEEEVPGIDRMRWVVKEAWHKPLEGSRKVFVIENAENLTMEASNSLLKVLEDPPGHCVFILVSRVAHSLPATVVSRCQMVPFRPAPLREIEEFLVDSGIPTERARFLAYRSRGILGDALNLVQSEKAEKIRVLNDFAAKIATEAISSRGSKALSLAEKMEETKEDLMQIMDLLAGIYRDLMIWKTTGMTEFLENISVFEEIKPLGQALSLPALVQSAEAVQEARAHIQKKANLRLALDVLVCRLAKVCRAHGREDI